MSVDKGDNMGRRALDLMAQWEELNISPDAFVTCAGCHRVFHWAAFAQDYIVGNVCGCGDVDTEDNDGHEV
jgi:hypothetical protein